MTQTPEKHARCGMAPTVRGALVKCPKCGDSSQSASLAKAVSAGNKPQQEAVKYAADS